MTKLIEKGVTIEVVGKAGVFCESFKVISSPEFFERLQSEEEFGVTMRCGDAVLNRQDRHEHTAEERHPFMKSVEDIRRIAAFHCHVCKRSADYLSLFGFLCEKHAQKAETNGHVVLPL